MHTRIYGTIGPACQEKDTLVRLFEAGMTGVRVNLSHTNLEGAAEWLAHIQEAYQSCCAEACGVQAERNSKAPEILMDLQGPELRIGNLQAARNLREGDGITLVAEGQNDLFDPTQIPVPECLLAYLETGCEVLLDDGKILLKVEELFAARAGRAAETVVVRGGHLTGRKSIALQGVSVDAPTLTESDLCNIRMAKTYGVTGVMLPFVRGKEDLLELRRALQKENAAHMKIFAKIENLDGVRRLPELLAYSDEIVIARGDLGNALPLWELPAAQAHIAEVCRNAQKPFMVVTQMLASMEERSVPTRAEVSDIYRAVAEGAASVMLTGETAAGGYPVEAMRYMGRTVRAAEAYLRGERKPDGLGVSV